MQSPHDFEAAERSLSAHMCYVTMALESLFNPMHTLPGSLNNINWVVYKDTIFPQSHLVSLPSTMRWFLLSWLVSKAGGLFLYWLHSFSYILLWHPNISISLSQRTLAFWFIGYWIGMALGQSAGFCHSCPSEKQEQFACRVSINFRTPIWNCVWPFCSLSFVHCWPSPCIHACIGDFLKPWMGDIVR